jgi:subtilisin family serine protease
MRFFLSSRSVVALAVGLVGPLGVPVAFAQIVDPPATYKSSAPKRIPGQYIVVFKDHVTDTDSEADKVIRGRGGVRHFTFSNGLKGFVATLPDAALAGVRSDPNVDYIEQDQVATINATENLPTGGWGLDRIDQVDRPLDSLYKYSSTGAGVNAFIIDTGIRAGHSDFAGRVLPGYSAIADGNGTNDCNGHGTHVAGTVGGTTWGVAKGVKLIPVRVLDCSGSGAYSGVIAGIDWVANSPLRPAVANLSLGGGSIGRVGCGHCQCCKQRGHSGSGGRQRQRQCLQLLTVQGAQCNHGGRYDKQRRARLLFKLWILLGHFCPGQFNHIGVVYQ